MEWNKLFINSCFCMSLRTGVITIGILDLLIKILIYISELAMSIVYVHVHHSNPLTQVYGTIEMVFFEYILSLDIIFGVLFLYGVIRESSGKTHYIFSYLLLKVIDATVYIMDLFVTYNYHHHHHGHSTEVIIEDFITSGLLLAMIYFPYCYYRTLPKSIVF